MKQLSFLEPPSPSLQKSLWKLYIDGAARNNPGPAGVGFCIEKDTICVYKQGYYVGSRTNNQAEYLALLIGLYAVQERMPPHDILHIISDSQLLVRQFNGEYKIKHPELKPLHMMAKKMLQGHTYRITHILREENTVADAMANDGIDKKRPLPAEFLQLLKNHEIIF